MNEEIQRILKLKVPVIVRLGHRRMPVDDVLALGPGAIIELPQSPDDPLDLMVNNKLIGNGVAVKIGENFGLRVAEIGDQTERIQALAGDVATGAGAVSDVIAEGPANPDSSEQPDKQPAPAES